MLADTAVQIVSHRVVTSWPWYVVRASGFVAAGLLILLMLSGIGQVTGIVYRLFEPVKAWAIHRALAYALLGAILVHVVFILLDSFVSFSLVQVLVPFVSTYNNKSSLFGLSLAPVALASGILAMYGIVVIVATSLGWIDSHKRAWKWTHYLGYVVILLVFIHSLGVGTDVRYGIFREVWIILALLVLVAIIGRLRRAWTLRS